MDNRSQFEANKETVTPPRQGPLSEGDVAEPAHVDERMPVITPTQAPPVK